MMKVYFCIILFIQAWGCTHERSVIIDTHLHNTRQCILPRYHKKWQNALKLTGDETGRKLNCTFMFILEFLTAQSSHKAGWPLSFGKENLKLQLPEEFISNLCVSPAGPAGQQGLLLRAAPWNNNFPTV